MSDVPIRHGRRMRRLMLALSRTKTLQQRVPLIAQMLKPSNLQPEVHPAIWVILTHFGFWVLSLVLSYVCGGVSLLGRCPAGMQDRCFDFGSYLLKLDELR